MKQKLKGFKSYREGKVVADETLCCRTAKPSIFGGDLSQRMANFYGKRSHAGEETTPSPLLMITNASRFM